MDKEETKRRIEKLKKEINHYRRLYHVEDQEIISQEALDSLKKELFDLELKFPDLVTPDSPTQRIGGEPLKEFVKIKHEKPMLSFNDAFSEEDMRKWIERTENYLRKNDFDKKIPVDEYFCELKIDGLAVELVYEKGILKTGSTRGDGLVGEDITQNLKTIESIPLNIKTRDRGEKKLIVRGEIFITKKEFERINKEQKEKGEKLYANPRNVAAGSVRQLDPKVAASRKLDAFMYDIVTDLGQRRHSEEHEILEKFGFKTNPNNKIVNNLERVFRFRDHWEKSRESLEYEIDGVVVIINNNEIFEKAGFVGKAPRGAVAYKFSPNEATSVVRGIKIQVGRTGILTPVAELEPVSVGGVTISHASLHNFDEIERLGVKIGDTVIVRRAGDVIPKITEVLKNLRTGREKKFKTPQSCPVDGFSVRRDGVFLRCSNSKCGARHREMLRHFVSRSAFDIRGLGGKIIDRFLDEGLISDIADIFTIEEGDIAVLEGFGDKSASNIVEEIKKKKKTSFSKFLLSLGILHVGEETSRLLASFFINNIGVEGGVLTPREIFEGFRKFSREDLEEITDIGPKVSESIYDWFQEKNNFSLVSKLDKVGVTIFLEDSLALDKRLKEKKFVLSGSLESMSRSKAKDFIRSLGGEVKEGVSREIDFLVIGKDPGQKLIRAKNLGIKIINENEFLKLVEKK